VRGATTALLVSGVALATLAAGSGDRWFEDVTDQAGVSAPHRNRQFDNEYATIMAGYTALGASAAVADFDGDGFDDLFVTDSAADGTNRLYRNNGDWTFTDVTAASGLGTGNDEENASADSLWFDFNNDGRPDLFVVRFGRSLLFENLGGGKLPGRDEAPRASTAT
jgi:enediyne biosynthesis protein E4